MADPYVLLAENRAAYQTMRNMMTGTRSERGRIGLPVTLCGPSGSGKTALIKHVLSEARASQKSKDEFPDSCYWTGLDWADDYRRADRDGATADWLRKQQQAPTLIIDGVDVIARRAGMSEQLAAVVDSAIERSARVVLTIASLPGQQRGFSRRLADRIRGGTILPLDPLRVASAEKLLQHFLSRRQIPADADAVSQLSSLVGTTPGDVLRAVKDLETHSIRNRSGLTPAVAAEFIRRVQGEPPSIPQIARAVAKEFSARVSDLRAQTRAQAIVIPRQTAMFLARHVAGEQYQTIGHYFGNRNHSTVVHSVRRVEQMLDDSPEFASRVVQIRSALGLPN